MFDSAAPHSSKGLAVGWQPDSTCSAETSNAAPVSRVSGSALHTALTTGLDRLSHGVALLDVDGHAWYANAAAHTLFSRAGWCVSVCGTEGERRPLSTDWAPTLRQVCLQGRRELLRMATPHALVVAALTPLAITGEVLAFTVFGRDELCGSVELQMFALQFQLTNAETMVLRQLARGLDAAAIALEHGVARTTVLTQIAAIRSKTQCASVRALLGTLARMPPIRPLQPVAELR